MDCQMPVLDGFSATRAIRADEALDPSKPRTRIVALTAHAMRSDRDACLAAGMDDYLSKPFTREQLRDMIERWIPPMTSHSGSVAAVPPGAARDAQLAPTFDPSLLAELDALAGEDGFREELIAAFIQSSTRLANEIAAALDAGDTAEIARAAHTLASSSAQVGGMRLAQISKTLEAAARSPEALDLPPHVAALRTELESLHEGLAVESLGATDV
jgi:CheY-like chemotaxis protein